MLAVRGLAVGPSARPDRPRRHHRQSGRRTHLLWYLGDRGGHRPDRDHPRERRDFDLRGTTSCACTPGGRPEHRSRHVWWSVVASRTLPTAGVVGPRSWLRVLASARPDTEQFPVRDLPVASRGAIEKQWLLVALGKFSPSLSFVPSGAGATAILTFSLIHTEADARFLPLIFVVPLVVTSALGTTIVARSGFANINGARADRSRCRSRAIFARDGTT